MSKRTTSWLRRRPRSTAAAVLSLLVCVQLGGTSVRAQEPAREAPRSAAGGPREGIKVHGHWTIDVRRPDGTLVTHREFENALTTKGATVMAQILGHAKTAGRWSVSLLNHGGAGPVQPCWSSGSYGCFIVESDTYSAEPLFAAHSNISGTLTVSAPETGANAGTIVLKGSAVANITSNIESVGTGLGLCSPDTTTTTCSAWGLTQLASVAITFVDLSEAIPVVAQQIIQVTVVLSFS